MGRALSAKWGIPVSDPSGVHKYLTRQLDLQTNQKYGKSCAVVQPLPAAWAMHPKKRADLEKDRLSWL